MEPHRSPGQEANEFDIRHIHGDEDRSINWQHFNGCIRLAGSDRGVEWYVLLNVEIFVEAIFEIIGP